MSNHPSPIDLTAARWLKAASLAEAVTLAMLILVAVPLKHLAHIDIATRIVGPIHGVVFLFYIWTLIQSAAEGSWRRAEIIRMLLVACIPLGGFFNQPWLDRKIRALRMQVISS